MSAGRRKKKNHRGSEAFDINVTPMVDMFSVLISFLLITAVFSATGQARVDVPFLSSKAPEKPEKDDKSKPVKNANLIVSNDELNLIITLPGNSKPIEELTFTTDDVGLDNLQGKVYEMRLEDMRFDLVTIMTDETTVYETLTRVIDALRVLSDSRQPLAVDPEYRPPRDVAADALVPKIVLGNVIL